MGENAEIIDDGTQTKEDIEFSINDSEHTKLTTDQPVNLYKTETEKLLENEGLPRPKVLGKIDLDSTGGDKRKVVEKKIVYRFF